MIILVKAINEIGQKALNIHKEEVLKFNRFKKAMLKRMGISYFIPSDDCFELHIDKQLAKHTFKKHLTQEIKEALKKNGASYKNDYVVVIDE